MIKYEDIRPEIKTGDVIAFSGNGLTSSVIKLVTRSDISHVGIVLSKAEDGRIYIIESTSLLTTPDAVTGELHKGVQIQYLSDRIRDYDGEVYHVPLIKNLKNPNDMIAWLIQKHEEQIPYDTMQAIGSALDIFIRLHNEEDFSSLFCSELITKALQLGGVVPKSINASEMHPEDVMQFKCLGPRSEELQL